MLVMPETFVPYHARSWTTDQKPLFTCKIIFDIYENNQQDELYRLIYYSKSALRVSGDVLAHHQEHLTVFTISGSSPKLLPAGVSNELKLRSNTVKCSLLWAKTSPGKSRAGLE
jgi:hypothetical protein